MIDVKGITKSFGKLQVLKGIDLHINKGEVVSIVGPSGAGKTTLLQIIGTLDKPDSGSVVIDSVDVGKLSTNKLADFRNEHIGFVFQFHQLLPEFTALENVMIPAFINGKGRREAKQRAMELLDFMGLADRAGHKPNELSGEVRSDLCHRHPRRAPRLHHRPHYPHGRRTTRQREYHGIAFTCHPSYLAPKDTIIY